MTDYIIPMALDVPEVASMTVETVESTGPFGMKDMGDVAMNGPLPVIAGAVQDAVGSMDQAIPDHGRSDTGGAGCEQGRWEETVSINCKINGKNTDIREPLDRRAVDVLREYLGLTGTKEGCGAGGCGACRFWWRVSLACPA